MRGVSGSGVERDRCISWLKCPASDPPNWPPGCKKASVFVAAGCIEDDGKNNTPPPPNVALVNAAKLTCLAEIWKFMEYLFLGKKLNYCSV